MGFTYSYFWHLIHLLHVLTFHSLFSDSGNLDQVYVARLAPSSSPLPSSSSPPPFWRTLGRPTADTETKRQHDPTLLQLALVESPGSRILVGAINCRDAPDASSTMMTMETVKVHQPTKAIHLHSKKLCSCTVISLLTSTRANPGRSVSRKESLFPPHITWVRELDQCVEYWMPQIIITGVLRVTNLLGDLSLVSLINGNLNRESVPTPRYSSPQPTTFFALPFSLQQVTQSHPMSYNPSHSPSVVDNLALGIHNLVVEDDTPLSQQTPPYRNGTHIFWCCEYIASHPCCAITTLRVLHLLPPWVYPILPRNSHWSAS